MEEPDFLLQPAYDFLQSKGRAAEATAIRKANPGSKQSLIKHAMVLAVLRENDLLRDFLATAIWTHGTSTAGQQQIAWLKKVYERYQQTRTLTCDQITVAVRKYDNDPKLKSDDSALRKAIQSTQQLEPSLGRFVAEVCVVADWGSIEWFPFEDRRGMAEEIEKLWPLLTPTETSNDWDTETERLLEAVDDLASHSELLPEGNAQLSFLSKYLHFCVDDAFPIWDSNSRLVLGGSDKATWDTYRQWVIRVRQEVSKHKECLESVQTSSESLIRTLDKALYIIGDEIVS
jgi:hypothetical protein